MPESERLSRPTTNATRLILVRHGETVGNSSIRYFGRTDVELSDLGRAQMRAVARLLELRFAVRRFEPVMASPLRRATAGARLIVGSQSMVVEIPEFVEVDFGLFEGLTAEEIRERYPADFALWDRNRIAGDYAYPGGESRASFAARVERGTKRMLAVLDGYRSQQAPADALLVAHRGVIRAITRELANAEPQIELGSIQLLERAPDGRWRALALDVTEHLSFPP